MPTADQIIIKKDGKKIAEVSVGDLQEAEKHRGVSLGDYLDDLYRRNSGVQFDEAYTHSKALAKARKAQAFAEMENLRGVVAMNAPVALAGLGVMPKVAVPANPNMPAPPKKVAAKRLP